MAVNVINILSFVSDMILLSSPVTVHDGQPYSSIKTIRGSDLSTTL